MLIIRIITGLVTMDGVVRGGSLALEGVEEVTGIPLAAGSRAFVRAAMKDMRSVARSFGSDAELAGREVLHHLQIVPRSRALEGGAPAADGGVSQAVREAEQRAAAAEAKAAKLEAEVARLNAQARTQTDVDRARVRQEHARAMRRAASSARFVGQDARQVASEGDIELALAIALQAIEMAKLAQSPPPDAQQVLAISMPARLRAFVADFVDSLRGANDPDYARTVANVRALVASDSPEEQAANALVDLDQPYEVTADVVDDEDDDEGDGDALMIVEGAPRKRAKAKACSAGCDCAPCKGKAHEHAHGHEHALEGNAGDWTRSEPKQTQRSEMEAAFTWAGAESYRAGPAVKGSGFHIHNDTCATGTCSARRG